MPLLQVVARAYSSSIWEAEARESGVQGYPWLHIKFKVSMGYMRAYLPNPPKKEEKYGNITDFSSLFSSC